SPPSRLAGSRSRARSSLVMSMAGGVISGARRQQRWRPLNPPANRCSHLKHAKPRGSTAAHWLQTAVRMTRTLAISAIALALAGGAGSSAGEEDTLVFEGDGGKADSVRPYGSFERELAEGEAGLTHLTLNE